MGRHALGRVPKFLLIASIASAGLSAALGLAAIWDHPGYNVAAAALALLTAILGIARTSARLTGTGRIQREHLVLRLRQLPAPIEFRVVAVPDDEAVHFAQELLDVFVEGGWPAMGLTAPARKHREHRPLLPSRCRMATIRPRKSGACS